MSSRYSHLPTYLAEALERDDAMRAGEDNFQRRIEELQAQRRNNPQLVHKTFETPHRATKVVQPQQQPDSGGIIPLPAHVQKRWAEWCDARIKEALKQQFYRGEKAGKVDASFLVTDFMREGYAEHRAKEPAIVRATAASLGDVVDACWKAAEQLGIVRRAHDEKIAALEKVVEDLQQQIGALKVDAEVERAAKVIELPNPLRKRDAAA